MHLLPWTAVGLRGREDAKMVRAPIVSRLASTFRDLGLLLCDEPCQAVVDGHLISASAAVSVS